MSDLRLSGSLADVLGRLPGGADLAVVGDGAATVVGLAPSRVVTASGPRALEVLEGITEGWWAGFISYDLGRAVERVPELNPPAPDLPDLLLARFDTRLRLEAGTASIEGETAGRVQLERLLEGPAPSLKPPSLGPWTSSLDRGAWTQAVLQILDHLRAGNCYQVNLTRRLHTRAEVDPVALFGAISRSHPAPHAALVRIGEVSVVSASPESFLRRDGRRVSTRPIKGTAADADELRESTKDRAENVMVVDLARNDLGRVCEHGTIHVPHLWSIEQHPGLYHLVSTVTGTLRNDVSTADLLRATFPPASVTGCPKPRVLRIIEELEPVRRGVYCGAVGFIDADQHVVDLNVAIRTFTSTPTGTSFGVGGGIVADSDPNAEWEETELKARRLLAVAAGEE